MKRTISVLSFLCYISVLMGQTNVDSVSNLTYDQFVNDIWGYVAPDGVEYALVGTFGGVSIVSLATPENPTEVAFVGGSGSTWRDIKTWGQYAYVTTEAADGLQVINLSDLPNSVSHYFWNPSIDNSLDTLQSCHNLYIDEFGYCYLSGSNLNNGGFIIADVFTNPDTPKVVGIGPAIYSHDIYVRDNIAYSSDIEAGVLSIHDVTNKDSIQFLGMLETPFRFTHNAWLSDDGNFIFTTDEVPNAPTAAYDITDLEDIKELNQFIPSATAGQGVIPHNVHYHQGYLVISHYGDGLVIVDAHRPDNLVEVGNYDTAPFVVSGFGGAWGAYPFLPSGLVLVSDSGNGLFVVRPDYKRASYLEGVITDASTGEGVFGASIEFGNVVATSGLSGEVKTGIPETGMFEVTISKRGYLPQTVSVDLNNGEVTPIEVTLEVAPTYTVGGIAVINENGDPIEGVAVNLIDGEFTEQAVSGSEGIFIFENVLASNYTVVAGKWGYSTAIVSDLTISGDDNTLMVELTEGIEDPFALDLGWTVEDNVSFGGGFELGTPVLDLNIPFIANDVEGDIGTSCYSTAILGSLPNNVFVAGSTVLTSPVFDMSGMMTPTISYSRIYGNVIFTPTELFNGVDTFYVVLDNGVERQIVEEITNDADVAVFGLPIWRESVIRVQDFMEPTATMTISFELNSTNFNSVAEAGVDDFKAFDAGTVSVVDFIKEDISFSASPNPFVGFLSLAYDPGQWEEIPNVVLFNALGKVLLQNPMPTNSQLAIPSSIPSGVYFVQLRTADKGSRVIKLIK